MYTFFLMKIFYLRNCLSSFAPNLLHKVMLATSTTVTAHDTSSATSSPSQMAGEISLGFLLENASLICMSLFILFFFLYVSVAILAVVYCAHMLKLKGNVTPHGTDLDVFASTSSTTPGKTSTLWRCMQSYMSTIERTVNR